MESHTKIVFVRENGFQRLDVDFPKIFNQLIGRRSSMKSSGGSKTAIEKREGYAIQLKKLYLLKMSYKMLLDEPLLGTQICFDSFEILVQNFDAFYKSSVPFQKSW
ncbi:hypothetical protein ACFE04_019783 [Oxalis oulophora]